MLRGRVEKGSKSYEEAQGGRPRREASARAALRASVLKPAGKPNTEMKARCAPPLQRNLNGHASISILDTPALSTPSRQRVPGASTKAMRRPAKVVRLDAKDPRKGVSQTLSGCTPARRLRNRRRHQPTPAGFRNVRDFAVQNSPRTADAARLRARHCHGDTPPRVVTT